MGVKHGVLVSCKKNIRLGGVFGGKALMNILGKKRENVTGE